MIVGLLGILKAGGAYLPLDPEYPKERLAFALEDAETPILLTQQRLLGKLPGRKAHTICLDSDWGEIAGHSPNNPGSAVKSENLAYIIYTSGSTGSPKGVQVTHVNVGRLLAATQAWFAFDATDVWTLFHSYAFDFSVWEIWGSLLHGGRLVIVPFLTSRSPELFHELLRKEQVTVLNQTPSAFLQEMESDRSSAPDEELALRLIIFGGEALDFGSLKPWFARHGDEMPQLVNMYGITETTVHVTYLRVRSEDLSKGLGSRIGRPIPDLQVYILDQRQNPVPIGVAGELYIGGAGLARGYLKRPELNAEKFIRNPFSDRPGSRLYRTGDLGRYLPDGSIEYIGRVDSQVKIRGFRIELGEIEDALRQHPAVHEAVVTAREDTPGDKRLVAYYTGVDTGEQGGAAVGAEELRRHLARSLPEYMLPAAYVKLEALPLTPNGKLDRKALPAPEGDGHAVRKYEAPQGEVETTLAGIWADVLKVERVGRHDQFFELGGHSLLATRLIGQVHKSLNHNLPFAVFFQDPTIEGMARVLQEQKQAKSEYQLMQSFSHVVPIRPQGSMPPLFVVPGAGGSALAFRDLVPHLEPDLPIFTILYSVSESRPPILRVEDLAARYIEEMRKVQPEGPYYLLGHSFGGLVVFEMAQQLLAMGQAVGLLGLIDTHLTRGPQQGASKSLIRWAKLKVAIICARAPRVLWGPDRLLYVRDELASKMRDWIARVRMIIYATLTTVGRPIPKFLERAYDLNWFAARRYRALPYPGRVTLFRATIDKLYGHELWWKHLAGSGVEVHEIFGTHLDIVHEPNVQLLARELTACLTLRYGRQPSQTRFLTNGRDPSDRESVPRQSVRPDLSATIR